MLPRTILNYLSLLVKSALNATHEVVSFLVKKCNFFTASFSASSEEMYRFSQDRL